MRVREAMRELRRGPRKIWRQNVVWGLAAAFVALHALKVYAEPVKIVGEIREFVAAPGFEESAWDVAPVAADAPNPEWSEVRSGDFNGDGCDDLLFTSAPPQIALSDCQGRLLAPRVVREAPSEAEFEPHPAFLDDDDCADLLFVSQERFVPLRSTCAGGFIANDGTRQWPAKMSEKHLPFKAGWIGTYTVTRVLVPDPESQLTHLFVPAVSDVATRALYFPPRHTLLGTGDFLTGRPGMVLVVGGPFGDFKAFPAPEDEGNVAPLPLWQATFPVGYSWSTSFIADFNGDSLSDVLSYGGPVAGWWLAQSNGSTGIESAALLPWKGEDRQAVFQAGDFDGDGFSELLRCKKHWRSGEGVAARCAVARLIRGQRLKDAEVSLDGENATRTSESGQFELSVDVERLHRGAQLQVSSPTHLFNPISSAPLITRLGRRLAELQQRPSERMRIPKNVLAVSKASLSERIGAPLHYVPLPPGPKICLGYSPAASLQDQKWGPRHSDCPAGYAWLASHDSDTTTARRLHLYDAYCCPLPADDILLPPIVESQTICPENMVAVGTTADCESCPRRIRCQGVNVTRYQLGPRENGTYFGQGASSRWHSRTRPIEDIPEALRLGVRRRSGQVFNRDGCIGGTHGAIYVGNEAGNSCRAYQYRELQYAGKVGDPPRGTPVPMFPDCRFVPAPDEVTVGCVAKGN